MQGGKTIFPKEMNANLFFWNSHWLESGQTTFVPLWDRMEGVWLWTQEVKTINNRGSASTPLQQAISAQPTKDLAAVVDVACRFLGDGPIVSSPAQRWQADLQIVTHPWAEFL